MPLAEKMVWDSLRNRQLLGFRFRRQHPLGTFVADFVCLEAKLIVELDGSQHREQQSEDAQRTKWLESQGFRVIRFWNYEVLEEFENVLEGIGNALQKPTVPRKSRSKKPPTS